jgi:hypothetical protein
MKEFPLELREKVITSLVADCTSAYDTTIPYISDESKNDVFNVRLTSRAFRAAAMRAFAIFIENRPFYCTESSLDEFNRVITEIPNLAPKISTLTICAYESMTNAPDDPEGKENLLSRIGEQSILVEHHVKVRLSLEANLRRLAG